MDGADQTVNGIRKETKEKRKVEETYELGEGESKEQ